MSLPIAIGIVGLGRAGYGMHLPELKGKEKLFRVAGVCDLIPERMRKVRGEYGCKAYSSIESLVKDPEIELVDIATRSCDHFHHAKLVLEAGKTVFLEKPVCMTEKQAEELGKQACWDGKIHIFARHNRRFEYSLQKIREVMEEGLLGEVYEIHISRASFQRRNDWQTIGELGGGQLLNWGPHIVDHSLRLLGTKEYRVESELKQTVAAGNCEDHLTLRFIGENGRTVIMRVSGGMALPVPEYEVYGTRGAMRLDSKTVQMRYIDPEQKLEPAEADPGTPGQTFGKAGTFRSVEEIRWIEKTFPKEPEDLSVIWRHLYRAIREGEPYPIPWEEALEVMQVISQVKESPVYKTGGV